MSIDIFSLRAIDNISASVARWKQQLENGLSQNLEPEELEVDNPRWALSFAGYVTQQYTAKRDSAGDRRPVKAFDKIMQEMPAKIQAGFLEDGSPLDIDAANLGSIPTFHSLVPMSQTSRKPIFELRGSDGVVGAHFQKVKEFREIISGISARLMQNLDSLG